MPSDAATISPSDPAALLEALVRAASVTPDVGATLDLLEQALKPAGFEVHRPVFSAPGTPDVENLFAAIGSGGPHLTFAGHVDVVPPGPAELWRHDPFGAIVEDGVLYGRGACDMKGGVAAMVAAALAFLGARGPIFGGRLSLLVTGDEEGPAVNGTAKLLEWAAARGERFDAAIVGEPTSREALGDQIKVGRRGSFSATLAVEGRQGHAA
jgi:succinyl-diaminopimelate desuccinylase